jgi:transcriptional regulator with XRE-family HTH domain
MTTNGNPVRELNQVVLERRKELGLSQQEVADAAGISRNYVSMIERGIATNVSFNIASRLAGALEMNVQELVFGQKISEDGQEPSIEDVVRDPAAYIAILEEALADSERTKESQGELLDAVMTQLMPGLTQLLLGQTTLLTRMFEIDQAQQAITQRIQALGGNTVPFRDGDNNRWFWDIAHERVVYVHRFVPAEEIEEIEEEEGNSIGIYAEISWFDEPVELGNLQPEGPSLIPANLLLKISGLVELPY